ncbi:MAG: hypothetical protein Q8O95_04410 [bacterium]|nr:hypothetical protein [bacterium]
MFPTATITDLRFKTDDVFKKGKKVPVWIFVRGKKQGFYIGVKAGEKILKRASSVHVIPHNTITKKTPSLLDEVKKYQIKGPKDLSQKIDEYLYE